MKKDSGREVLSYFTFILGLVWAAYGNFGMAQVCLLISLWFEMRSWKDG